MEKVYSREIYGTQNILSHGFCLSADTFGILLYGKNNNNTAYEKLLFFGKI